MPAPGGVGQSNHQIDLSGLHLLERPPPGHPFHLQPDAAFLLQPVQDLDIDPLQLSIWLQNAKGGPDIGRDRQRRHRIDPPRGKQQ